MMQPEDERIDPISSEKDKPQIPKLKQNDGLMNMAVKRNENFNTGIPPVAIPGGSSMQGGLTNVIAIDCEMVGAGKKGRISMLARVSVVNEYGEVLLDKYVKPWRKVVDYRTKYSGIREADIKDGEDFGHVREQVKAMLQGRILVGHALEHDFMALNISHQRAYTRDTSRYKSFQNLVGGNIPSLKNLSLTILGQKIQKGEHSSVEDAKAAMSLYMLHREEWEANLDVYLKDNITKKQKRKMQRKNRDRKRWKNNDRRGEKNDKKRGKDTVETRGENDDKIRGQDNVQMRGENSDKKRRESNVEIREGNNDKIRKNNVTQGENKEKITGQKNVQIRGEKNAQISGENTDKKRKENNVEVRGESNDKISKNDNVIRGENKENRKKKNNKNRRRAKAKIRSENDEKKEPEAEEGRGMAVASTSGFSQAKEVRRPTTFETRFNEDLEIVTIYGNRQRSPKKEREKTAECERSKQKQGCSPNDLSGRRYNVSQTECGDISFISPRKGRIMTSTPRQQSEILMLKNLFRHEFSTR
ncbi:uncharacterized protein LOC122248368 isoform X2 [Penaeus japonicus]|uniref:uncharacterized protein LOC122248368 isoform X2 n=1 Tax=Penaeus japonicus TaxID=27405 RepID=UPI001C70C657|nr:uncharacterized protein LOC122248368 isoform X2 [Penaeus japonicus]